MSTPQVRIAADLNQRKGQLKRLQKSADHLDRGRSERFGARMRLSSFLVSDKQNFAPYGISPLSLEFKEASDETAYKNLTLYSNEYQVRGAFVLAAFINLFYALLDPFIYAGSQLIFALAIRFFWIMPPLLLHLSFSFKQGFSEIAQKSGIFAGFFVGTGWFLCSFGTEEHIIVYNLCGLLMTLIYGFFFTGLFFRTAIYLTSGLVLIFSISIWSAGMNWASTLSLNTSLIFIFLQIALAGYNKELSSRQLFYAEAREKENIERQRQTDAMYLDRLQQLAKFLRHEVRQPVAQINSSLELVQLEQGISPKAITYLDTASQSTQAVWALIECASRATDATAFIRQGQPQTLDLASLLEAAVGSYRQTYSGVDIQYEGVSRVLVFADAVALNEVVGNIVNNAVSYSDDDTAVAVNLSIDGLLAHVKIYNKGPLLDKNINDVFRPFASSRSKGDSEHHGLGLYVVKMIVEYYGGTAGINNSPDASGVEAWFRLPVAH